jgi:hypothetical protein
MVAWAAGFSVLDSVYGAVLAVALWMTSMMTPPKTPGMQAQPDAEINRRSGGSLWT